MLTVKKKDQKTYAFEIRGPQPVAQFQSTHGIISKLMLVKKKSNNTEEVWKGLETA